jgi:amino acid transporter
MKAWLQWVVSIDAALVLSGGVLTSYVGVVGLVRRMALDRCLPTLFLNTNKWRGTNHWIIIIFFIICSTMYLVLNGKTDALGGVYTIGTFLNLFFSD